MLFLFYFPSEKIPRCFWTDCHWICALSKCNLGWLVSFFFRGEAIFCVCFVTSALNDIFPWYARCVQFFLYYNAIVVTNQLCKQWRSKLSLMQHQLQLETISKIDHWERPSDVCCLKMTVLNCSIYHRFLKALVYKKGHYTKLNQRL